MADSRRLQSSAKIFRFRQSDALLRNVMENAAVGMVLVGDNGRLVYANRAYAEMFGYELDECIGLGVQNLVHPEDIAAAAEQLRQLTRGEIEVYRAERRFRRKDGSHFWAVASASVLRGGGSGRPIYTIVQTTDIDAQKRAEAALAESEIRLNFALEGSGQGVWDHDVRNKRVFYSRMWRTMRGIPPGEVVEGTIARWLERVHPDDHSRIREAIRSQNTGAAAGNAVEYRERHRDGHWIWILSRGKAVEWQADGSVARITGTDTDITGLKAVEAELAEEKERLRVTLHSISDGVITTDAEGHIRFMNPTAEALTGWQSSAAWGRPVTEVFSIVGERSDGPITDTFPVRLATEPSETFDRDVLLCSRTGEQRYVRHSSAPVKTQGGEVIGRVLVFQDITASRLFHKQLAHSAAHDELTGLPNRAAFKQLLDEACAHPPGEKREHAICFIDLDRFKAVNDIAGHAAGDAVLKEVASAIGRAHRSPDVAARIGGDEFALLLVDCPTASALKIAEKIVRSIKRLAFRWQGSVHRIGASIGLTAITAETPSSAVAVSEADAACYAAKSRGRNQVVVFDRRTMQARENA